nr:hypothetical protein [uncultured Dyadobacter sp.]
MDKYVQSDFVARITITETFPNQGQALHYKSNIVIRQLFKGTPVKSIAIMGSSDGKRRSSCDIFFKKGTDMLVYARKTEGGRYIFDSCSGYVVLTKSGPYKEKRELQMLDFLKQKGISPTSRTQYGVNLNERLKAFRGETLTKRFAVFEVTFTGNLTVDSVATISGFNPALDEKLAEILKQSPWVSDRSGKDAHGNKIPPGSKLLFAFYYYPAEGSGSSFISEYDF